VNSGTAVPSPERIAAPSLLFAALLVIAGGASHLDAQEARSRGGEMEERRTTVVGQVLERGSGEPIPGATVRFPGMGRTAVAGPNGIFVLEDIPVGVWEVTAERLGYRPTRFSVVVQSGVAPYLPLERQPLELAGVRVTVAPTAELDQRLDGRAAASGRLVRVMDREALAGAGAPDLVHHLVSRGGGNVTHCSGPGESFVPSCVRSRGRLQRIRVYFNELEVGEGMPFLGAYPIEDLHRVEFYPAAGVVRAYSIPWVERMTRSGWRPGPIFLPGMGAR